MTQTACNFIYSVTEEQKQKKKHFFQYYSLQRKLSIS